MLQKEVVMRMVGEPGTEEYGRLSVMLQYRFNMARLFDVPPGAFRPAPKVMSSIVRMVPRPAAGMHRRRLRAAGKIVTAAFGQRRKTLRNPCGIRSTEGARRGRHRPGAARRAPERGRTSCASKWLASTLSSQIDTVSGTFCLFGGASWFSACSNLLQLRN